MLSRKTIFSSRLIFTSRDRYYSKYIQKEALDISLGKNTYGQGAYIYVTLETNGDAITFPSTWKEIKNEYGDDSDNYGLIVFYDGEYYQYSLYLIG